MAFGLGETARTLKTLAVSQMTTSAEVSARRRAQPEKPVNSDGSKHTAYASEHPDYLA